MIRRQDIAVLLLHYLGYSRVRNSLLGLQQIPAARFVTFHDLPLRWVGQFRENMRFLKDNMHVISLGDYYGGRLAADKVNVVITFDDGYKSWVTHAVPILRELDLPATFFICSGGVGLSGDAAAAFAGACLHLRPEESRIAEGLSEDDVRTIAAEGFTVGGHTVNHCNLSQMRDRAGIVEEIMNDRIRLEAMTGNAVEFFAYPSGACHNPEIDLIDVLREAGYRGAVTTAPGHNTQQTDPFLLRRELTGAGMGGAVFRARASGNYDVVRLMRQAVRVALFRE